MKTMPSVFVGHGSPMLALDHNDITRTLTALGQRIITGYGRPKAILMISAHWYKDRNLIQRTEHPRQVYDMYGFPRALYEVKYPVHGCTELSDAVLAIKEAGAVVDNSWGIDHGTWTPLVHVFPKADIPIVQLSVNGELTPRQCYEIGQLLSPLRSEGYLIMGSGNVVHNLRLVNWDSAQGSPEAVAFNRYITDAVEQRADQKVIDYTLHPQARYAAPTADHFLPLLYVLGSNPGRRITTFNNHLELDSMAMTGYLIEE
jgi:4,5-DOPA dioxygenase extradiol